MMASEEIAAWVVDTLENLPSDGGDNTPSKVLEAVYGFDAVEFEGMVQSIWAQAAIASRNANDAVGRFSVIMFELGAAWNQHQAERARELFGEL